MTLLIVNFFKRFLSLRAGGPSSKLSLGSIAPTILVPSFMLLASLGIYFTIAALIALPFFLCHVHAALVAQQSDSKFFFMWNIVSLFYMFACLEFIIVPLMVISPWENFAFYAILVVVLTNARQIKRKVVRSIINEQQRNCKTSDLVSTKERYCSVCCRKVADKSVHCSVCRICVFDRSHHNVWFDCCIGYSNRASFIFLLISLFVWLIYTAYLMLTTVCISYLKLNAVLIPENCSHVYSDLRSSLTFVGAIYCGEIALYILVTLSRECVRIPWDKLPLSSH